MEKALVNRVYWAPDYSNAFTLGASGSQVTVKPDGTVHQHNDLMAPGDPIMIWRSHENYQFSKAVPQLPMLCPGRKYRIVIHGSAFPVQTVTYRLTFIDSQGHEVKRCFFNEQSKVFTFPADAINYEVVVVNAGSTDFYFRDLEISAERVPAAANSDFWIQEPVGDRRQPRLIFLIAANERRKENFPELAHYSTDYNILPVVIDRVTKHQLVTYLERLLADAALKNAQVVACDARFDAAVLELARRYPEKGFMVVGRQGHSVNMDNVTVYWQRARLPYVRSNTLQPDWPLIFTAIGQNWG